MRNFFLLYLFLWVNISAFAQFAPPAGQIGSTAMHADSSIFVGWANTCSLTRGYQDISNTTLGYALSGDSSMATGKAGINGFVSLGDGGNAILTFPLPIKNNIGWDFAVFENAFDNTYLELAFVEVSSDGINFYRFPATSNTQDTIQIGGFGAVDATKINNLAGKYKALYGTPFDLQELEYQNGLNINNITHVKIIDAIGCITNTFASFDKDGHIINDPWSTPFNSGGFDLDAIGVINQAPNDINELASIKTQLNVFPNPMQNNAEIQFYLEENSDASISITDITGKQIYHTKKYNQLKGFISILISEIDIDNGIYFLILETNIKKLTQQIIISR